MKKNFKKIVTGLALANISLIIGLFFLATPIANAAGHNVIEFKPQVPIPGFTADATAVGQEVGGKTTSDLLARYIQAIYKYGFGLGGLLAAVVLMGGGILWLTSGGSEARVSQAKKIIAGSITGLMLLFGSWMLLNTVNPELLKLHSFSITGISTAESVQNEKRFGCCECKINTLIKQEQACITNFGLTEKECSEFCKTTGQNIYYSIEATKRPPILQYKENHKWDHKCGVEEAEINTCVPYKSNSSIIYSPTFNSSGWTFQSGIEKQTGDISPELAQLLNCMRDNLPAGIGEISSISDSNYTGDLSHCNKTICVPPPTPKLNCVHSCGSCHYGGGKNTNKSYAVDFGDEQNYRYYKEAAEKCDYYAYVLKEDNHVHVSSSACPRK